MIPIYEKLISRAKKFKRNHVNERYILSSQPSAGLAEGPFPDPPHCSPGTIKAPGSCPGAPDPQPYHVWVSEIMVQQTRVEAVKPYFDRFLTALPTIQSLAQAPEDQLLKLWGGLGLL